MNFDPIEFGKGVGAFVRKAVAEGLAALNARVESLEAALKALPSPKDGVDGTSVTVEDVRPLIAQEVAEAVKQLPPAEKGVDGRDADPVPVEAVVSELLAPVKEQVADFLKAIPIPKDGQSVTVAEVVEALTPCLELLHNRWALDFERRAQDVLIAACDRIPKPKDGLDGMGFEDIEIAHDGERRFCFRLSRDGQVKEFPFVLPAIIHRGLFVESTPYEKGDAVTWGGSLWISAKDDPEGKPGESKDWSLASKRGRDGKSP